jgi:hypothetical protein
LLAIGHRIISALAQVIEREIDRRLVATVPGKITLCDANEGSSYLNVLRCTASAPPFDFEAAIDVGNKKMALILIGGVAISDHVL